MRATLRSTRLVEGVVCQSPLSTVPATALVWFEEVLKLYILDLGFAILTKHLDAS